MGKGLQTLEKQACLQNNTEKEGPEEIKEQGKSEVIQGGEYFYR